MSQWGMERIVNGARFIPLVDSQGFEPARGRHPVADVILVDNGGDSTAAHSECSKLKETFCGKPYSAWLNVIYGRLINE